MKALLTISAIDSYCPQPQQYVPQQQYLPEERG